MAVSQLNEAVLKAISEHLPAMQMEQLREQLNLIPAQAQRIEDLEKRVRAAEESELKAINALDTLRSKNDELNRLKELWVDYRAAIEKLEKEKQEHALKVARHEGRAEALTNGLEMLKTVFNIASIPPRVFNISGSVPVAGQSGYPDQGSVSLSGTVDG